MKIISRNVNHVGEGKSVIAKEDPVLSLLSANYFVLFSVSEEKPAH